MIKSSYCQLCKHYVQVEEIYPSGEEPVIVYSWHKCNKNNFICLSQSELKAQYEGCRDESPICAYGIPHDILNEINILNKIDSSKRLISPDMSLFLFICYPCRNNADFMLKLGAVASLLELNIKVLRSSMEHYEDEWKGLKLLDQLFKEKNLSTPEVDQAIDNLKSIPALRSKSAPFHLPSPDEAKILANKVGIDLNASSPEKWQNNADKLLEFFLSALKAINKGLEPLYNI